MSRTFDRIDLADRSVWFVAPGFEAAVNVRKVPGGWQVSMFENGSCFGTEPIGSVRSGEIRTALRWCKALSKPQ